MKDSKTNNGTRNKGRIIATVISMMMVISVLCIGIWAAVSLSFGTNDGTISYTVKDVCATISVTQNFGGENHDILTETPYDLDTPDQTGSQQLTLLPAEFTSLYSVVTYTITIRNDFEADKSIFVDFTQRYVETKSADYLDKTTTGTIVQKDLTSSEVSVPETEIKGIEVAAGATLTITATVTVADTFDWKSDLSATYGFDFNVDLEKESAAG